MKLSYGYIKRTQGADGDHVDCFVGPYDKSPLVYVIHTKDQKTDKYDEDKVMLGFDSPEMAMEALKDHYGNPENIFLDITSMAMPEFKQRLEGDWDKDKKTKLLPGV